MNITHHKNGEIKTLVDEAPYHPGYEDAGFKPKAVNNKPVAWMLTLPDGTHDWIIDGNGCKGYIPLYTHPVKELTDEEILKMATDKFHYSEYRLVLEFARAIIRKAQEK